MYRNYLEDGRYRFLYYFSMRPCLMGLEFDGTILLLNNFIASANRMFYCICATPFPLSLKILPRAINFTYSTLYFFFFFFSNFLLSSWTQLSSRDCKSPLTLRLLQKEALLRKLIKKVIFLFLKHRQKLGKEWIKRQHVVLMMRTLIDERYFISQSWRDHCTSR